MADQNPLEKLKHDVQAKPEVREEFKRDPEGLAVRYGLAKDRSEVTFRPASDKAERVGADTNVRVCGHLCSPILEGGLEVDYP